MSTSAHMFLDVGSDAQRIEPREAADNLDATTIHLWWLRRTRAERRGPLQRVLAGYLGVRASDVTMRLGTHGRPELAGAFAGCLDFNWSHSRESAVLAIARDLPRLGVDIEYLNDRRPYMQLAQRYFGPDEIADLAAMPRGACAAAFVRLWTAKEAILKAEGRGLAHGLEKVVFAIREGRLHLRRTEGLDSEPGAWRFAYGRVPADGFVTLCWHGKARTLRHYAPASRARVQEQDEIIS